MRSEWRASRFQGGVSPCECRAIHTGSVVDWRAARREAATTRLNVRYSSAIWSYLTGSTPGGRTIRKMVSDLQLLEYVLALRFVVKFSELALVPLPCPLAPLVSAIYAGLQRPNTQNQLRHNQNHAPLACNGILPLPKRRRDVRQEPQK
jgi:hypothetical protein